MNLKIMTFNVRGLNHPTSTPTLHNYFATISNLDILCIQETKLRGTNAASLGQKLWPQVQCRSIEASQGYANAIDGSGAGKGGIATLLTPRWALLVTQSGIVMGNRAH
jgi:exonuclease III